MSGCVRVGAAALLLLTLAGPAHGLGWLWGRPTRVTSYYYPVYLAPATSRVVTYYTPVAVYAPAPVVCVPGVYTTPAVAYPVAPAPAAVPVAPTSPYAVPTPAPPSQTVEPPLEKPGGTSGPKVTESRAAAPAILPATAQKAPPEKDRCRVGFWNVSGRDVTLTINGQARLLPRDRSLTLDLGRQFIWQVDARPAQTERVPADNSTLEIVVRQ